MDPVSYSPDTLDIWSNRPEMDYWLSILGEQVDNIVEKAIASEGNSPGALPLLAKLDRHVLLSAARATQKHPSLWKSEVSQYESEVPQQRFAGQSLPWARQLIDMLL